MARYSPLRARSLASNLRSTSKPKCFQTRRLLVERIREIGFPVRLIKSVNCLIGFLTPRTPATSVVRYANTSSEQGVPTKHFLLHRYQNLAMPGTTSARRL